MQASNVVLISGRVTVDPTERTLPSGDVVTQFVVATRVEGRSTAVPVSLGGVAKGFGRDDDVVLSGHVQQRFFRAGGVTQSRTEVVTRNVVKASRVKAASRLVTAVVDELLGGTPA